MIYSPYTIAGKKIFIRPPEPAFIRINRTWSERLFEWPWNPIKSVRKIPNGDAPTRNKLILDIGGMLSMTQETYNQMQSETRNQ